MKNKFPERYFNDLKNGICPFCGKELIYSHDCTKSKCQDTKCQYNDEIDLSKFINEKIKYERKILGKWVE